MGTEGLAILRLEKGEKEDAKSSEKVSGTAVSQVSPREP